MSPRHRFGGGIPAPTLPEGAHADRFIAEHMAEPWSVPDALLTDRLREEEERRRVGAMVRGLPSLYSVRAGDLYDRYVNEAEVHERAKTLAPGEKVLSHRDFGLLLAERGFPSARDEAGNSYYGLTLPTRAERADEAAQQHVRAALYARFEAEAKAQHMAEVSHTETHQRTVGNPKYGTEVVTDEVEVPCTHTERTGTALGSWAVSVWLPEAERMTDEAIAADPATYEAEVARVRALYEPILQGMQGMQG